MKILSSFFIVLLLAGCSNLNNHNDVLTNRIAIGHPSSALPKPSLPHIEVTSRIPSTLTYTYKPFKQILLTENSLNDHVYSFLYLPRSPVTYKQKAHYELICEFYKAWFYRLEDISPYLEKHEKTIPVYWFSRKQAESCKDMISQYDHNRAKSLYPKKTAHQVSLVAVFDHYVIRLSLEDFKSEEDLEHAFSVWEESISQYPKRSQELDVVTLMFSVKKVLGVYERLLTFSRKS